MDLPRFTGRNPLTKETMNEIIRRTKANERLVTTPEMEVFNLGSLGKIVSVRRTQKPATFSTAYSGQGFWARIYVSDGGTPDHGTLPEPWPDTPYLYLVEQMIGLVPPNEDRPPGAGPVDRPDGRTGYFQDFNCVFQHLADLAFSTLSSAQCLTLINYESGSFRLQVFAQSAVHTTSSISYPPTATTIEDALEALGVPHVTNWTVTQIANGPTAPDEQGNTGIGMAFNMVPHLEDGFTFQVSIGAQTANLSPLEGDGRVGISTVNEPQNTTMVNVNPHGQLVFVQQAFAPDGKECFLFDLPLVGMWGRITGPPDPDADQAAYPFIEQKLGSFTFGGFIDYLGGSSGFAFEINGERGLSANLIAWMIPIFIIGVGFVWIFQAPNDMRLLRYTGGSQPPNCVIVAGRTSDSVGTTSALDFDAIKAFMLQPDRSSGSYITDGYYFGQRSGTTNGYATFLVPEILGTAGGWTGTFTNQAGTVTVNQGRIQGVS